MNRNNIYTCSVEFKLRYRVTDHLVKYDVDTNAWYIDGHRFIDETRLKQFMNVTRAKEILLAWRGERTGLQSRASSHVGPETYVTKKKRPIKVRKRYQVRASSHTR